MRCDIPAPRTSNSRVRFAFVEYESRRDADDAYHEMHNKRMGRDEMLKIEWARTPPSASWRFDSGTDRPRGGPPTRGGRDGRDGREGREGREGRDRSPRRRSVSPRGRGGRGEHSPRKDDRRERDYDRRERDRTRSPDGGRKSPMKLDEEHERRDDGENGVNGDDHHKASESPAPVQAHDELDTAE